MFNFNRHYYAVSHAVPTATNYELIEANNNSSALSDIIRVEKYRGFSKATQFEKLLYFRIGSSWKKSLKTGLFPTVKQNVLYGDVIIQNRKHLIVAVFSYDNKVRIDHYQDYPSKEMLLQIIATY